MKNENQTLAKVRNKPELDPKFYIELVLFIKTQQNIGKLPELLKKYFTIPYEHDAEMRSLNIRIYRHHHIRSKADKV